MPNRMRAILYTGVVFLAGCLAGGLLMNLREHLWVHRGGHVITPASWARADRAHYVELFKAQLKLTDAQSQQLENILDETMRQYLDLHSFSHHIRAEGISRIRAILDENQRKLFEEIISKKGSPLEQRLR